MSTYTYSESVVFSIVHARQLASKVATDLKRMQRFYSYPSDKDIADYEAEIVELLKGGYLGTVRYGFKRNELWIVPMLSYNARDLAGGSANDDDPGRIKPGADVTGASFYSYLTYSDAWTRLAPTQKEDVKKRLPFQRVSAEQPGINGYLEADRTYSSGGRALDRASLRSW
jgi:hypothetical protein